MDGSRRVGLSAVITAVLVMSAVPSRAATPQCATSAPASAAYEVTACIVPSTDDVVVRGDVTVTATVQSSGAGVSRVEWFLDATYVLRDLEAPYDLVIPTAKFADGVRTLSARVLMTDGFVATRPQVLMEFANGLTSPPVNSASFTPVNGDESGPVEVAVTGDGAGSRALRERVAEQVASWDPDLFLYLGDVYERGTYTEHYNHYGHLGSAFDRLRAITNPIVGNHEYLTPAAAGYFDYWDNVPHSYSATAAGWQLLALDSTTAYGQLAAGSGQYDWLAAQLAAPGECQLAFFHHPRFSIGGHGDTVEMDPIWRLLAGAGVEMVLTGHEHHYQRWTAMNADGQPAAGGMTQFIAGAGGQSVRPFARSDSRVVRSLTGDQAVGALRLTLRPGTADYQYVAVDGTVKDSGSIACDPPAPEPGTTTRFDFSGSGVPGSWRTHTFSVEQAGDLTATLDWDNAAADLNLSLYNAAGTRIAFATSSTARPEVIRYALPPGTYKLGVGFRLANANYSLAVVVDHGGGGPAPSPSPSPSPSPTPSPTPTPTPSPTPPSTTRFAFAGSGTPGAWRTHDFTVTRPGKFTATLDWDNAAADLNLSLYNSAGKRVAKATGPSAKPEVVRYTMPAGTYRLGVGFKLAPASYTIAVEVAH